MEYIFFYSAPGQHSHTRQQKILAENEFVHTVFGMDKKSGFLSRVSLDKLKTGNYIFSGDEKTLFCKEMEKH